MTPGSTAADHLARAAAELRAIDARRLVDIAEAVEAAAERLRTLETVVRLRERTVEEMRQDIEKLKGQVELLQDALRHREGT